MPLDMIAFKQSRREQGMLPTLARAERVARLLRSQADLLLLIHDPSMAADVDDLRLAYSLLSKIGCGQ